MDKKPLAIPAEYIWHESPMDCLMSPIAAVSIVQGPEMKPLPAWIWIQ